MEPLGPRGHLFIGHDLIMFMGEGLVTRSHHHFTASVTLALDAPLVVHDRAHGARTAQCMIARPNAEHALDAQGGPVLNLQIDPETEDYLRLVPHGLVDAPLALLQRDAVGDLLARMSPLLTTRAPDARAIWSTLLGTLGQEAAARPTYDDRVANVLRTLKEAFPEARSAGQLAASVGMSEGRLIRLFHEQVGVPLRRYVLWLRLRHVVFCLAAGENLTDAAHDAGFSDSAHLTRVFGSMFGMAPSQLLRSNDVAIRLVALDSDVRGPHAAQDVVRLSRVFDALFSEAEAT